MDAFNIHSPSPDGQHTAHFVVGGEIRFGPLYFSLSIDDYSFGPRIFGDAHLWSPTSQLLAVQEWLTIDYSVGPITTLLLIDLERRREATLVRVTKGFVVPESFEGSRIVYRKEFGGQAGDQHFDQDIAQIREWSPLT